MNVAAASHSAMELMICCAARLLEDGKTVAVGTGVPCAAAMLAQRTHAPNLVILFEAGGIAPLIASRIPAASRTEIVTAPFDREPVPRLAKERPEGNPSAARLQAD